MDRTLDYRFSQYPSFIPNTHSLVPVLIWAKDRLWPTLVPVAHAAWDHELGTDPVGSMFVMRGSTGAWEPDVHGRYKNPTSDFPLPFRERKGAQWWDCATQNRYAAQHSRSVDQGHQTGYIHLFERKGSLASREACEHEVRGLSKPKPAYTKN